MGADNKVTMQLLSKGTNGEITLQYMGTKVLKFHFFVNRDEHLLDFLLLF